MTDTTQSPSRARIALLAILTIAVVGVIIFAMIQQNIGRGGEAAVPTSTASPVATESTGTTDEGDSDVEMRPSPGPGTYLEESKNGQEAIDALGDKIEVVAKRNGKTVDELTDLLLRDETAYVSPNGFIVFKDGITKK